MRLLADNFNNLITFMKDSLYLDFYIQIYLAQFFTINKQYQRMIYFYKYIIIRVSQDIKDFIYIA